MTSRLHQHYARWVYASAVPLILVIVTLGGYQFLSQRDHELDSLRQALTAQRLALHRTIKVAQDHVEEMRQWAQDILDFERNIASSPLRPLLGERGDAAEQADGIAMDAAPADLRHRIGNLIGNRELLERRADATVEVDMALGLYPLMRLAHLFTPYLVSSYYLSGREDFVAIYPWVSSRRLIEGVGRRSTADLLHDFFTGDPVYHQLRRENNPKLRGRWTELCWDSGGTGLTVSRAAPVYQGERFIGVVKADMRLDFLTNFLKSMNYPVGQLWIVNGSGQVLADTEGRTVGAGQVLTLAEVLPAALRAADPDALLTGSDQFREIAGHQVLALPLSMAPWTILYAAPSRDLNRLLLPRLLPYGVILAGLCLTLFLTQLVLRRRFVAPAIVLADYISAASRSRTQTLPQIPPMWRPWLEIVSDTFKANRDYLRRVQNSEALKTAIIDSALDAIITINEASEIVEFNPSAERIFGYRRDSVLGRPLADVIIPPELRQQHDAGMHRYLEVKDARILGQRIELDAMRADGSVFPVELAINEVPLADRRLFTAYLRDLSPQKQAEAEIARQRETLHQSEKLSALGSLLAGVAHELNNPLAVVVGRSIMLEEEVSDPEIAAGIHKIRDAAERCARIVKTFIAIAREHPPQRTQVQLNDVIESTLDLVSHGLRSHGIELTLDLEPALPELRADADQLKQVFMNLIINAQQAMLDSDRPCRLWISSRFDSATHTVQARFTDNGPGVPEDIRSRIFEPFFTTKAVGMGIGVGLSVSHSLIEAHDGAIAVENTDHGGASFVITLPVQTTL